MSEFRLDQFVEQALAAGASREETVAALEEAGWSGEQIKAAMAAWSEVSFSIPVPKPRAHLSAKDAFIYLILFGTLYVVAFELGVLLFQFIEIALPDPVLESNSYYANHRESAIQWAIASLVICFPVFVISEITVQRAITKEPLRRNSLVRKWLTYLTMAIAVAILIGDLIYLLDRLLGGELQLRFVLKSIVVGGIAALVLAYYLNSMQQDDHALNR